VLNRASPASGKEKHLAAHSRSIYLQRLRRARGIQGRMSSLSSSSSSSASAGAVLKTDSVSPMEVETEINDGSQREEQMDEDEGPDMKVIAEEYKVWKKNAPYLYDLVLTHALEWPSLTTQWLEKKTQLPGKDYSEHEMLLGTHTADDAQNHLLVVSVRLPNEDTEIDARQYDDERGELGGYGGTQSKIQVKVRINHDGEVNKARYMHQDDYIIGTKTTKGQVHVFHIRDHESSPVQPGPAQPDVRCLGHSTEGYGLDWNALEKGEIISSADDGTICSWNVADMKRDKEGLQPAFKLNGHDGVVGDVQWHKHHKDLFGSVGDDCIFKIWDKRSLSKQSSIRRCKGHHKEINSLSFSPYVEFLLLTGGSDSLVKLWDFRKLDHPLHIFEGHQNDIYKVEWSPFNKAIAASCGSDRRLCVWDLSRIGQEQSPEDAKDGPPELLFMHGGHTATVTDFSWNKNDPWVISSVSEDNIVQVWQMAQVIHSEELAGEQNKKPIDDSELE